MNAFLKIFQKRKALVGMVHVHALPGTPGYRGSIDAILEAALRDAQELRSAGMDGVIIENMHDLPYLNRDAGPEITACMTRIGLILKQETKLPTGIQILAAANKQALAVAQAAGLDFIRAEGFVFGHVADEGWIDAQAGELLRYRKQIGAENVAIFADIKKKHSAHAVTADVDLLETARAAEFFLADGVIVTGTSTGAKAKPEDLEMLHGKVGIPVWVGSGIDLENAKSYASICDGVIVGSSIKVEGKWQNPVDGERSRRIVDAFSLAWNR